MSKQNSRPIIIKRKKVVAAEGHHGGAWKVAYADFVTAMMAFFLLMWLLNATTEKQRKGLADYFSPSIPISRVSGGGDGSFGGRSVEEENILAESGDAQLPQTGVPATGKANDSTIERDFARIEEALTGLGGESTVADALRRHIVTRVTDEGLVIEIFDQPGEPLFRPGTSVPSPLLSELAVMVADALKIVTNPIALTGHINAQPAVLTPTMIWPLSTARADRMRQLLIAGGADENRMARITGFADRTPLTVNPLSSRNARIEVILLRSDLR